MRIVDVAEERRMKEIEAENEARMPEVIENEYFRLELKEGKIESINIAMMPLGGERCIGICGGTLENAMRRTADCLVNLATAGIAESGMSEEIAKGMLRAVLAQALSMIDMGVMKVDGDKKTIEFHKDGDE